MIKHGFRCFTNDYYNIKKEGKIIKRKFFKLTISLLLIFISIIGCSSQDMDITINSEVRKLTHEEYEELHITESVEYEDLYIYELTAVGKNLDKTYNRLISIPTYSDIKTKVNKETKDICFLGKITKEDNPTANFFNYSYKIILDMKEISLDELKDRLKDLQFKINIEDKNGKNIFKKEGNLGELIK